MFEVGKEVVCIKSHTDTKVYRKGQRFMLNSIRTGCKHSPVLLDIGINVEGYNRDVSECKFCNTLFKGAIWVEAKDFAPIDNTLSDTTVEEILTEIGELELINE